MSKVIIVCGAGGKTSYINNISKKYKNKKVIITTTTKIFKTEKYISHIDEETFKNNNSNNKSMLIKVTDQELLNLTGGIIQRNEWSTNNTKRKICAEQ